MNDKRIQELDNLEMELAKELENDQQKEEA
jgi:hypothetical protein